jgi:hypothetical protein
VVVKRNVRGAIRFYSTRVAPGNHDDVEELAEERRPRENSIDADVRPHCLDFAIFLVDAVNAEAISPGAISA